MPEPSGDRKFEIRVQSVRCPLCKAEEVDKETGLLNIRGFKVGDEHGWWSECLGKIHLLWVGRWKTVGKIWFVDSEVTGEWLIEVVGSGDRYSMKKGD